MHAKFKKKMKNKFLFNFKIRLIQNFNVQQFCEQKQIYKDFCNKK